MFTKMCVGVAVAHTYAGGGDAAMDRALLDNFARLMNHLIFTGLDKKP